MGQPPHAQAAAGITLHHMRVAVADVGTNSSHLLIAEALPGDAGGFRVIDTLKDRTRLGECLDTRGELTPEGEERLASALTRFRELAASAGAGDVRVYATSALREAPNGAEVAERVRQRTGLYPAVISGVREGELTYLGVREAVELGPDNVLLDLGGGSLEFVRGAEERAADVLSLPLGAIRMTRAFPEGDGKNAGRDVADAVARQVRELLRPHAGRFAARPGTQFFLSSGTAEAAADAIAQRRGGRPAEAAGGVNGERFTLTELADLLAHVARLRPAQRARVPGLERRGDTILAALSVLHAALDALGAREVTVSEGALREGMLIEELAQVQTFSLALSTRQRSVLATAGRFGVNLSHAGQVAELSRELFDRLLAAGETFPPPARSLLTAAAVLHEAGQIVSQSSHHKHGAYLIRHAGLRGFGPQDIELIAQIARYHRKSLPKPSHPDYVALAPADRALVARLAGILRVADGLDRAHTGLARVDDLRRQGQGWQLRVSGVTPLDLAGVGEKGDLWAREFGPLSVQNAAEAKAT
ncbi:Ppx/GppA phosphatase family protein [Deinococcus radiodurans]|uniref:Ppx/GppA phosphatase family protein n=1 Tax=Deinococcus radiodurans TaxID=1299 RepID=UPI0002F28764|nr:Ppx/GppA phosphatase family protein [Deinococcus radiodurans]UID71772.1 exopolyphosphatase [Deinococcus radiodurans R1 = ATCC 13939 = DSM 20539]